MVTMKGVLVMGVAAVLFGTSVSAEQPEKIERTVKTSIDTRKETQQASKSWHTEKDKEKARYFQLKEEIEEARLEEKRMKDLVDRQDAYIKRQYKKLIDMEKIRQELFPYLEKVVARMENEIAADLPFLQTERAARLDDMKGVLYDPEVSLGEKFRRVYEGLRVEMEYGRSVEVTKEEIMYEEKTLLVHVLRIGRTALVMQTIDGKDSAVYHEGWKPLPNRYNDEIKKAIDIAQRKRPVEFVNLPVKVVAQ